MRRTTTKEFAYINEMSKRIEHKIDNIMALLKIGEDAEDGGDNAAKSNYEVPDKSDS